ncbi:retrovirus-related pol polyprotein from transposon TNT 1-94 [Tanacetum coccineum]
MAKIQEVPTSDSGTDTEPLEQVQYNAEYNVFANERQHSEQPESISNTCVVEKVDKCDDERVALANLIANFKLDVDENKKIQKQLKKANTSLAHELKECKSILAETSRTLGESNSIRDSCLIVLQNKQTELETYKTLNDRTVDYDKLECKLNETLGLLAQKKVDIKEGLKFKACKILVVKKKHDELVKQSFLTKSHYEGLVKEKTKVITDLKLKEEKDIDKMISMEKKLKFLNEIVYKRNQSIQTIHMLAPKGSTFNGRPTFANPMYLKKAQSKKPCLYEILYGTFDLANIFVPDREETLTLEKKSRSKLNKDLVKPYDYTKQNSLYEIFKPTSQEYHDQLAHANEDETPEVLKDFLKMIQRNLQAKVITIRTNRRIEFLNKTLYAYFKEEGIEHQTSTPRTPEQNGVVERGNYTTAPSQQELDLLFGPQYDKFFTAGTLSVNKSSSPTDNSKQQNTPPTTNIQSSTEPTTPTNVNAKENNNNQAVDTQVQQDEFINPFCTSVREVTESTSRNIDNSNMHTFYQP